MPDHHTPLTDRAGEPIERPLPLPSGNALFGSDVVAETLRALEIPFIALNPGASYRGFHDSLVNYLGNVQPQMLLCLHEEHAVAIAQGYFQPRKVRMGVMADDDRVQILEGLAPGETVVTSGQFLLDVESRTTEAIDKLRQSSANSGAQAGEMGSQAMHPMDQPVK